MKKISYDHPAAGIFYLIPNPTKVGKYTVHSELQEEGADPVAHLFLFDKVRKILEIRFKTDLGSAYDAYMGIPRGRIEEPSGKGGEWIIAHGGDFPLNEYKSDILSDFSLNDASAIGKVKFEIEAHEKMSPKDKKSMEEELGIEYTATGWKKRGKK
jgi:hypothetical protein